MNNEKKQWSIERLARYTTRWIGSINSILVHTALFLLSFLLMVFGVNVDRVLLVLTTVVSLEAIYLAIFIQMTVNRNTARLRAVSRDIDEIQEDVEEISEDIDEIQEDIDEIQEDVEEDHERTSKSTGVSGYDVLILSRIEESLTQLKKEIEEIKKK